MIVNSERALALICPACQKVQKHDFSIFTVSKEPLSLLCCCGFSQGYLRRLQKNYEVNVFSAGGDRVRLLLSMREFLAVPLISIFAPQTGREIGYFGDGCVVKDAVQTGIDNLTWPNLGAVHNPEIMHEILKTLQGLAEEHKIRCRCEHPSIGIDVYPDKVELVCSFCGSTVLIGAGTRKHQEKLSRVEEIVMEPSTYMFLEEWLQPVT